MIEELKRLGIKYKEISSPENPLVKRTFRLQRKRQRYKLGEYFIDDANVVIDGMRLGVFPKHLFLAPSDERSEWIEEIIHHLSTNKPDTEVVITNDKIIKKLSTLEEPHPIIGVYELSDTPKLSEVELLDHLPAVGIWGIKNPGNLGTIIRDMIAFGIKTLVMIQSTVDPYNPKVIRSAREGFFKARFIRATKEEFKGFLDEHSDKFKLLTTSSKTGKDIREIRESLGKWLLLLGSESQGIPEDILKSSHLTVRIPISDEVESLNVASAGAITLFWLTRVAI